MWIQRGFKIHKSALSLILGGALAFSISLSVLAENQNPTMLIRTVPLEVSSYPEAAKMDESVKTADGTVQFVDSTQTLLLHMEALRRAYSAFGQNADEKQKLMNALKDRYMADENNAAKFFDYGYAQLVMDGNKNGLFFLRKANDKLESPYTSLAYGIAQIDADILIENASPSEMTTRKMDAIYKLKDALTYNKEDKLPGIWPSYVNIMSALKTYPAYESARTEDVTTLYVPYGAVYSSNKETANQFLALEANKEDAEEADSSKASSTTPNIDATCTFSGKTYAPAQMAYSKSADLDGDGKPESMNFYNTGANQPYDVQITGPDNKVIGEFTSYVSPYIAEDLDGDGKYELVIRQFAKDPYHPLSVYRWNGTCFGRDKNVDAYFQ